MTALTEEQVAANLAVVTARIAELDKKLEGWGQDPWVQYLRKERGLLVKRREYYLNIGQHREQEKARYWKGVRT